MNSDSGSFDWKRFYFGLKVSAICLAIGFGGKYAAEIVRPYITPSEPPALAVMQESVSSRQEPVATLSSTTPQRVINSLTIADVVPKEGKFIAADLVHMKLYLYQDGTTTAEYPIATKGKPGTPWETPSGFYAIQTKEKEHFSTIGRVYMPYSMQFYGNYFIHGHTHYPDGTPTSATFSGGCIRLETEDAEKVFAFADIGTKVFVYDSAVKEPPPPLTLRASGGPAISASAYLLADIDTGDVYAEQNARALQPIASVTKLMTALVANEIISFNKSLAVPQGLLAVPPNPDDTLEKTFIVGDLFYPLLMQPGSGVADSLAAFYGRRGFVRWMNTTARALGMNSTTYADSSGASFENISTPEDQFRLAVYLANKKSFVLKITKTQKKTIVAEDGTSFEIANVNDPAYLAPFEGGQTGSTTQEQDTMVSVVSFKVGGIARRVAVIVLGSKNEAADSRELARWIIASAGEPGSQTACVSCVEVSRYRKIEL